MIGFLRGEVLEASDTRITLLVGGVGYQVSLAGGPEAASVTVGSRLELHIHTHVREDALDLFGFFNKHEKAMFLLLLGVNGIGPKGALSILGGLSVSSLAGAILAGDKEALQRIPGVGKKTAERVVLELADILKKKPEFAGAVQPATANAGFSNGVRAIADARDALVQLGFRDADVVAVLKRLEIEKSDRSAQAEDWIKWGLQQLR